MRIKFAFRVTEDLSVALGILLTLSLLLGGEFRIIGFISYFSALLLLISNNKHKLLLDPIVEAILCIIIIIFLGFLLSVSNGNNIEESIGDMLRYYLIMLVILLTYNSNISGNQVDSILKSFLLSFFILLIICFCQVKGQVQLLEKNTLVSTQIGSDLFLAICVMLYRSVDSKISSLLVLGLIIIEYLIGSRTAFFSCIVMIFYYNIFNASKQLFRHANKLFWIWLMLCFLIPIIYVCIYYSEHVPTINLLFKNYTGHGFFSGRQFLWSRAFDVLSSCLFWGNGVGFRLDTTNLYNGITKEWSVHNLFLYIMLQIGVVGLIIFCYLFYMIWKQYSKIGTMKSNCMRAFLLALLLQQSFSLGLVSGKMGYAFVCWFLLLIGVKKSGSKDSRILRASWMR